MDRFRGSAHPLEKENLWIEYYGRWVTDMDDPLGSKINLLQNGSLLN